MKSKLFWFLFAVQVVFLFTTLPDGDDPLKGLRNIFIVYLVFWFLLKYSTMILLYIRKLLGLMIILFALVLVTMIFVSDKSELLSSVGVLAILFLLIVNTYVLAHERAKVLGIDLVKLSKSN